MSVSLKVEERATRPRSIRNKLRHEGKIPAVVYGYQVESTPISLDEKDLGKILREHGANVVLTFELAGKSVNTLIHSAQSDTFSRKITHLELLSVNMNEETEIETEVVLTGEAAGVKAGGVLTQTLYNVLVSATPDKLPENIEVDVTGLNIGESLTVADLPASADYKIITPADEQVVAIAEAQAAPEEDTAEPAEPGVVGEEKE